MTLSDDLFRQGQIAFQGRLIADATHEIQNHFAVIKEYSGLIGDLLQAKQRVISRVNKRCAEITRSISERADRAAEMVDALNGFAHSGDAPISRFRVSRVTGELAMLLQRQAALRRVSLSMAAGDDEATVTNDASILHYLLFSLIAPVLDAMEENGSVILGVSIEKGGTVMIKIVAEGGISGSPEQGLMADEIITMCLERLAASISINAKSADLVQILLNIPSIAVA